MLFAWFVSCVAKEYDVYWEKGIFSIENIKDAINQTAIYKNVRISKNQNDTIRLALAIISSELHQRHPDIIFHLNEIRGVYKKGLGSGDFEKGPAIAFGEYLQRRGVFFAGPEDFF